MDIRRINLNLLLHLDTIAKERSVSKAAEKSFISQTAMSHILRQLRELFEDPLFIRKPYGLQPTQKTLELLPKIQNFIGSANEVFREEEFEPDSERIMFKAAFANYGEYLILSELCVYLTNHAPHFSLDIKPLASYVSLEPLLADELDFALAPGFIKTDESIIVEPLIQEKPVCVVGKNNPLVAQELNEEVYCQAEHIDIKFSEIGSAHINKVLPIYRDRIIKYTVPNVYTALLLVEKLNCIATIPSNIAKSLKDKYQFEIKPFPIKASFEINALYHKRMNNYKPLEWMISLIKDTCKKLEN